MKNLFIDSNIWLSLFHFTSDDLQQFNKLEERINSEIRLIIPLQVYYEIIRNREKKLKESLEKFRMVGIQYPVFCKGYEEYDQFQKDYNEILKRYKAWDKKIREDIKIRNLPADNTIRVFFEKAGIEPCEKYIDDAVIRYNIGNPPGKDKKYGDAINWECLLSIIPDGEDLYFISADKDYQSDLFKDSLHSFLQMEWEQKKKSQIFFYTNLVSFLSEHIKDIELKTEKEKQELIDQLKVSSSYQTTHGIIGMLLQHSSFLDSQIEDICMAVEENNQVGDILQDTDILFFYSSLLSKEDYFNLDESATKRVMYRIFGDAIDREINQNKKIIKGKIIEVD